MSDTFAELTRGIRFHKHEKQLHGSKFSDDGVNNRRHKATSSRNGPASSLDFFGTSRNKSTNNEATATIKPETSRSLQRTHESTANDNDNNRLLVGKASVNKESRASTLNILRKRLNIKTKGSQVPDLYENFDLIPNTPTKFIQQEAFRRVAAFYKNSPISITTNADLSFLQHHTSKLGKGEKRLIQELKNTIQSKLQDVYAQTRHRVLHNIEESTWKEPTPIQMQSIPIIMSGRDVLGVAPTGSGKSGAFLIPLILSLVHHSPIAEKELLNYSANKKDQDSSEQTTSVNRAKAVRSLILTPTRELADQIAREAQRLADGTGLKVSVLTNAAAAGAYSAWNRNTSEDANTTHNNVSSDESEIESVQNAKPRKQKHQRQRPKSKNMRIPPVDILVCTPKRLQQVLSCAPGQLHSLRHLVLDECDRLLEMGFLDQVDDIMSYCADLKKDTTSEVSHVQRFLFSATLPEGIETLSMALLRDPIRVVVGVRGAGASTVDQQLLFVGREEGKLMQMRQMAATGYEAPMLVFVQSKERAEELFVELVPIFGREKTSMIHSGRTQKERETAMSRFRSGEAWVLVCTELMGRGLDFLGVNTVVNYDFPQTAVSYVHRIGRTGRAGRKGTAITFFTENDIPYLRTIANVMRISGCDVPEWMLQLKKIDRKQKKRLATSAPRRKPISTIPVYDKAKRIQKRRIIKNSKQAKAQESGDTKTKKSKLSHKQSDSHTAHDKIDDDGWVTAPKGGLVPADYFKS